MPKLVGKINPTFSVGADLCVPVCLPRSGGFTGPGQTHRSAPTIDNTGLFLPTNLKQCLGSKIYLEKSSKLPENTLNIIGMSIRESAGSKRKKCE